eukprot:5272113-Lingulodinium_polyedra.AAC.1
MQSVQLALRAMIPWAGPAQRPQLQSPLRHWQNASPAMGSRAFPPMLQSSKSCTGCYFGPQQQAGSAERAPTEACPHPLLQKGRLGSPSRPAWGTAEGHFQLVVE